MLNKLSRAGLLSMLFVGGLAFAEEPSAEGNTDNSTKEPPKPAVDVEFIPSEEISEDKSVPFPADI